MNRRSFLRLGGAAAVITFTPLGTLASFFQDGPFSIDFATRTIYITAPHGDSSFTCLDLHKWLHELWEKECVTFDQHPIEIGMPTDNIITLKGGWRIDQDAIESIHSSSIQTGDGVHTGMGSTT